MNAPIMQKIIEFFKPTRWKVGIYIFFIVAILFFSFASQDCQPVFSSKIFIPVLIFLFAPAFPVLLLMLIIAKNTIDISNPLIIATLLVYYYIFIATFLIKLKKTKYPILFVMFSLLFACVLAFMIMSFPGFGSVKPYDSRVITAISQIRVVIGQKSFNENFDEITCSNENVKSFCSDIIYNKSTLFIAHDKISASKAVCVYAPLWANIKKPTGIGVCLQEWSGKMKEMPKANSWYCADSSGIAGRTDIDPSLPGYCVEGQSAKCPKTSD
jgi:hypothetical protein